MDQTLKVLAAVITGQGAKILPLDMPIADKYIPQRIFGTDSQEIHDIIYADVKAHLQDVAGEEPVVLLDVIVTYVTPEGYMGNLYDTL